MKRLITLICVSCLFSASTAHSDSFLEKLKKGLDNVQDQVDSSNKTSTPQTLAAENDLYLLDSNTQNCRGRLGRGCGGSEDPLITRNPSTVVYPCNGDSKLMCITADMSMGAIKHDICCDAQISQGKDGWMCWGGRDKKREGRACKAEWDQALRDGSDNERFSYTWRYKVGDPTWGETANWWFGVAPEGTKVSQSDPKADQISCHSNSVVKTNGVWVCGADQETIVASADVMVAENQSSTSSASGANSEVEIYGISLGMTKQEVIDTLKAKHNSIIVGEQRITTMVRRMGPNFGNFISFDGPIEQSLNMRAVIWPDPKNAYEIEVRFTYGLPQTFVSFAHEISFRHHYYSALSFEPKDFFVKRYGNCGGSSTSSCSRSGPKFRGADTRLSFSQKKVNSIYSIGIAWDEDALKEHSRRVFEARQENMPKADEPF